MDELIGLALQAAEKSVAKKRQSGGGNAARRAVPVNPMFRGAAVPEPPQTAVPLVPEPPSVAAIGTPQPLAQLTVGLGEMFQDGNSLLRAVIAAEVLGPPRALQESVYWQASRANEPSNSPD